MDGHCVDHCLQRGNLGSFFFRGNDPVQACPSSASGTPASCMYIVCQWATVCVFIVLQLTSLSAEPQGPFDGGDNINISVTFNHVVINRSTLLPSSLCM